MANKKGNRRKRIRAKIRGKISGTPERPRLAIYRSNKAIYAQVIDDVNGHTLCSARAAEGATGNKTEMAKEVGKTIGQKAKSAGIENVIFDRSGYLYHGRVKALADGAREAGLKF